MCDTNFNGMLWSQSAITRPVYQTTVQERQRGELRARQGAKSWIWWGGERVGGGMERGGGSGERESEKDNVKEGGDLASGHLQYLTGCDELSPFS